MLVTRPGIQLARHEVRQPVKWVAALERLGLPLLLIDRDGRELYRTVVLNTILDQEPARMRLLTAALQVAQEQLNPAPFREADGRTPDPEVHPVTRVRVSGARDYTIRVAGVDASESAASATGQAMALVALERRARLLPSTRRLRERFALTQREAEVALLLAQRRCNAEIAATLCVSVHTARHHTERVLEKLDVRRRFEVMRVLEDVE